MYYHDASISAAHAEPFFLHHPTGPSSAAQKLPEPVAHAPVSVMGWFDPPITHIFPFRARSVSLQPSRSQRRPPICLPILSHPLNPCAPGCLPLTPFLISQGRAD
ncbi:hypothetical protein DACRYDRAFT_23160 [Dacryopinax primogenitus]|uniref:Uncharacterized protein n=1 Tax=Dacryopinax primogenitus (strain DJM 731) TaxID=1858805 RepID=M5FTA9_DACPD|nr:uncharacterized protein DACRYDRAFT_23160 [Dacryopinax primogenitus]EJU00851.1 hypothetical protein DACRYDRAFT_23160 [Dacryopinax primogenitus]